MGQESWTEGREWPWGLPAAWEWLGWWGAHGDGRPAILHPFSVTYCIFHQPCSDSLVLCLEPQVLPLTERGKWDV